MELVRADATLVQFRIGCITIRRGDRQTLAPLVLMRRIRIDELHSSLFSLWPIAVYFTIFAAFRKEGALNIFKLEEMAVYRALGTDFYNSARIRARAALNSSSVMRFLAKKRSRRCKRAGMEDGFLDT